MSVIHYTKIWTHPDHLQQYNEAVARVKAGKPSAVVPGPTDVRGLERVLEILKGMEASPHE
jgi:hypothetical protein